MRTLLFVAFVSTIILVLAWVLAYLLHRWTMRA